MDEPQSGPSHSASGPLDNPEPATADPTDLLALANRVGTQACELILGRLGQHRQVDTKSSALDLVTEVDRASEELIVSTILAARPHDGILGEEGSSVTGSSGVDWVIDPIDGTTSFVYGLPGFSVSIAARIDGETVAGYVNAPVIASCYTARVGHALVEFGSGRQRRAECSQVSELATALVGTGFSPDHERRARQGVTIAGLLPAIRDIRRMGSAALDLGAVASGQLDAYFENGLSEWDWSAGAFIVSQAGGRVQVESDPNTGRSFIAAAAPGIADEFFAKLTDLGAGLT